MDLEKRTVIVREIEHWRRSKLLPEQYCDFLLNLYMDDSVGPGAKVAGISSKAIQSSHWKTWLFSFGIISLICFVALHFNSFAWPMQIGVGAAGVLLFYIAGLRLRSSRPAAAYLLIGLASILLLVFGLHILTGQGYDRPEWIAGYVAICSLLWLLFGVLTRLGILHLSGWIGLVLCYGWWIHSLSKQGHWLLNELYWVPAGFILGWLSWFLHLKNKPVSAVLFGVSCLLWMMPQVYELVWNSPAGQAVQLAGFGKLAAGAGVLYTYRKKWTEWVA
ncbi:hypothetical protein [Paenibacillus gansuensis]|uniref:DUF2157 domain-containing protein n=1 Tax=Paenibacillus gansuensis TaxID=306542 RepID=A0ABW5PFM5_9BACL